MPIGAVVGKATEMDLLAPVGAIYQAGTLSGNPVAISAGIATLKVLKKEKPYEKLDKLGKHFVSILSQSSLKFARAVQAGSILWLYLDETEFPRRADRVSAMAMERFRKIFPKLLNYGFYLPPSSYEVLFLSTAHKQTEIEHLAERIIKELKKLV
jgi:glutamate-1-semialdehyde 2,1-aminomutase